MEGYIHDAHGVIIPPPPGGRRTSVKADSLFIDAPKAGHTAGLLYRINLLVT